ncbi:MAG TPA: SDR family oxidoreductase [Ktedonobacterales bacterium]|nr:SDR family oxidoreductase [Ktedonobacterales bacterium]
MADNFSAHATTFDDKTDLRGQVALVTGASSGIGAATAEALVRRGVSVALAARRTDRTQALADRLANEAREQGADFGETLVVACDVRDAGQAEAAVQQTLARWGQLDIVVANAGMGMRLPLVESDPQRWKDMIDTNVYGLLVTLKYSVAALLERKRGHVIVMSSVAARVPTAGGSAYCGTKAAATAIADALRIEVSAQGVRVTTIEPGVVISEFQQVAQYAPEIVANMLKGATPLYPADIARTIVYALEQPASVGVHEIVIRPAGQTYP